jgi:hypothetical protein
MNAGRAVPGADRVTDESVLRYPASAVRLCSRSSRPLHVNRSSGLFVVLCTPVEFGMNGRTTSIRAPGDASAQVHRQGSDGAQAGPRLRTSLESVQN